MKRRKKFPKEALAQSVEWAKRLVEGHTDPAVSAGERLREIGKKLNVTRIEPGAVRTAGFVNRLPDRSFAIYYANDCGVARRRFTVAHELGHLVLERFHKHVGREDTNPRANSYHKELEWAVDRIAAELLMPELLVIGLMKTHCQSQRKQSPSGIIQKRMVLRAVGETLGVSEHALVNRLIGLPGLLCVLLRLQWDRERPERPRYFPASFNRHSVLKVVEGQFPDPTNLKNDDGWEQDVVIQTKWGQRVIHSNAWRRLATFPENGELETWILGWGWNVFPLPAWDDSEQMGWRTRCQRT
jgi:Zn-dependent peptidase ImmA (M78 family)